MKSEELIRAKRAMDAVRNASLTKQHVDEFAARAAGMGLGPALAVTLAGGERSVANALASALGAANPVAHCYPAGERPEDGEAFLRMLMSLEAAPYRTFQMEAMKHLNWFKTFAKIAARKDNTS